MVSVEVLEILEFIYEKHDLFVVFERCIIHKLLLLLLLLLVVLLVVLLLVVLLLVVLLVVVVVVVVAVSFKILRL
jgi:hypothetical protein